MTAERELIQRLADALHDAAEDVEGWGNYASIYFQEKHDLSGNIAKIHAQVREARAYLSQPEPEPLTQASIALQMLDAIEHDSLYPPEVTAPIRLALETLHHEH